MRKIESVIFDMSGVILDDIYAVWKADSDAFEARGMGKIENIEKFRETFRLPIYEYYKVMGVSENMMPKLQEEFRRAYPKYGHRIRIFPEVKSVLRKLEKEKISLAIVSNIPSLFLLEHIRRFGIGKFFNSVTGQEDCEEQKPSPKPILVTLEKINSKPEHSAYVGDMKEDIMAGKRAGVCTFAINRANSYHPSWRLKRHNPDFLISDLNELLIIVKMINYSNSERLS